jgi:TatD DNase family protein
MYLIDTHAHIYLPEFEGDRSEIIERARNAGIEKILMPAIDSTTHGFMQETAAQYSGCLSMIGLHPCSVKDDLKKELNIVENHLKTGRFIAIGEIGMDLYWDKTYVDQQYEAFHHQVRLALQYDLPIVIHSREAIDECIEVVSQYDGLRGVFHCFSGSEEQARRIIDLEFMLGIGGVVTYKNAGLDKVLGQTGLDHVILETDAPYLSPVPYRGKRNEPAYVKLVAEKLSAVSGRTVEEIAELTTANANKIFRLS